MIRDQETRQRIGNIYRTGTRFDIGPELTSQVRKVYGAAQRLEDHMEDVPVFILVCIQTDPGSAISAAEQRVADTDKTPSPRPPVGVLSVDGCLLT